METERRKTVTNKVRGAYAIEIFVVNSRDENSACCYRKVAARVM